MLQMPRNFDTWNARLAALQATARLEIAGAVVNFGRLVAPHAGDGG
jgi:hypothetical protein